MPQRVRAENQNYLSHSAGSIALHAKTRTNLSFGKAQFTFLSQIVIYFRPNLKSAICVNVKNLHNSLQLLSIYVL